jgi:osmoprotectant transport system ATP-binding protein
MLMDEPFGAVDPIVRDRLQNEFLRLQRDLAKTIVFVTHDIDEAIKLGDVVAVLQVGGVLAQFGTPDEILSHPASEFVARFVGADRGLKRLSLTRVRDVAVMDAGTAAAGERAGDARQRAQAAQFPFVMLLDGARRPVGWLDGRTPDDASVSESHVTPAAPVLQRDTTLKDALAMLLDGGVGAGIVVDDAGAFEGVVTLGAITHTVSTAARRAAGA